MFAESFVVHASCGCTTRRQVFRSLREAVSWAALWREQGWDVSEPAPYVRDNVVELRKKETA